MLPLSALLKTLIHAQHECVSSYGRLDLFCFPVEMTKANEEAILIKDKQLAKERQEEVGRLDSCRVWLVIVVIICFRYWQERRCDANVWALRAVSWIRLNVDACYFTASYLAMQEKIKKHALEKERVTERRKKHLKLKHEQKQKQIQTMIDRVRALIMHIWH